MLSPRSFKERPCKLGKLCSLLAPSLTRPLVWAHLTLSPSPLLIPAVGTVEANPACVEEGTEGVWMGSVGVGEEPCEDLEVLGAVTVVTSVEGDPEGHSWGHCGRSLPWPAGLSHTALRQSGVLARPPPTTLLPLRLHSFITPASSADLGTWAERRLYTEYSGRQKQDS